MSKSSSRHLSSKLLFHDAGISLGIGTSRANVRARLRVTKCQQKRSPPKRVANCGAGKSCVQAHSDEIAVTGPDDACCHCPFTFFNLALAFLRDCAAVCAHKVIKCMHMFQL